MPFLESKLIASKNIFKQIYHNSPIAFKLCDNCGKLIYANKACLDLFGVPDFNSAVEFDLFEDLKIPKKELAKLKKGNHVSYETEVDFDEIKKSNLYNTNKSGSIYLDVLITPLISKENKKIKNYLVQAHNITNYKKIEESLKASEKKFRHLLDNISSGVAIYEAKNKGNDFVFKDFNLAGEKIDNIKKEELVGKSVLKTFPGIKDFGLFNVFQKVWETGKPKHHPIKQYKDNRISGWRENYVFKLSSGEIVAIYEDLTEKMIAMEKLQNSEKKLKKLNEELEQKVMERTYELKESERKYRKAYKQANFYRELFAHDVKNILTVINSSAELFTHYLNGSLKLEDVQVVVENLKKQVTRGAKLVSNVSKLTKLEEVEYPIQKTDLMSYLQRAINYIKDSYQKMVIKINIIPVVENIYVKANELLVDVFENILLNAINYNHNSIKKVDIKISKEVRKGTSFIRIEFMDNGIGIDDRKKEIIFQRGERELKGAKGMGLGLSLVKRIIESYDGLIWVENRVANDSSLGSNFIVLIPEAQ